MKEMEEKVKQLQFNGIVNYKNCALRCRSTDAAKQS